MFRLGGHRRRRSGTSTRALILLVTAVLSIVAALWLVAALVESSLSVVLSIALLGGALIYGNIAATQQAEAHRRWHDIQHVRALSGVAFERHVAELYEKLGYRTRITRGGGDQGADVVAENSTERLAIQCKQWAETVGNDAVQEAIAGKAFYGCDRAVVVCTSAFTSAARELAERAKVALIDGDNYTRLMAQVRPRTPNTEPPRGLRFPAGKPLMQELVLIGIAVALVVAHFSTSSARRMPDQAPVTPQTIAPLAQEPQPTTVPSAPAQRAPIPSPAPSPGDVNSMLVVRLPTTDPLSMTTYARPINLPPPMKDGYRLSAYVVARTTLIAPERWSGQGSVGVDGTASATLTATPSAQIAAGRLEYEYIPVCQGCVWLAAGQYFDSVRAHWNDSPFSSQPLPPERQFVEKVLLAPHLLAYHAPDSPDGLEVNGVAYFDAAAGKFQRMEIALPAAQHRLATIVLNTFIARQVRDR